MNFSNPCANYYRWRLRSRVGISCLKQTSSPKMDTKRNYFNNSPFLSSYGLLLTYVDDFGSRKYSVEIRHNKTLTQNIDGNMSETRLKIGCICIDIENIALENWSSSHDDSAFTQTHFRILVFQDLSYI